METILSAFFIFSTATLALMVFTDTYDLLMARDTSVYLKHRVLTQLVLSLFVLLFIFLSVLSGLGKLIYSITIK